MLELKGVNSFYGDSHILFDVNMTINDGESVCLLGRNGVGKSTTIKSIGGLLNPDSKSHVDGSIQFAGKELVGVPPYRIARMHIAYVPQGRHIFPNLSVKENLIIAEKKGENGNKEWDIEKIYELFPRLKERENFLGRSLSGGEQQMLAISRGLMQNPQMILLDEIVEGLAPSVVNELVEIVNKLHEKGVTVLVAEQDFRFALECCSRCYIMEKGSIVFEGKSETVTSEVINKFLGI